VKTGLRADKVFVRWAWCPTACRDGHVGQHGGAALVVYHGSRRRPADCSPAVCPDLLFGTTPDPLLIGGTAGAVASGKHHRRVARATIRLLRVVSVGLRCTRWIALGNAVRVLERACLVAAVVRHERLALPTDFPRLGCFCCRDRRPGTGGGAGRTSARTNAV